MASSSSSDIQKIETTASKAEALSATIHTVATEKLQHFSHAHLLSLVQLQPPQKKENYDDEDEDEDEDKDEDEDGFVVEEYRVGECKMCEEEIYSFHLCYYSCEDCEYSLHKFCAQLPLTQQNHPLHPGHNLTLSDGFQFQDPDFNFDYDYTFDSVVECDICRIGRERFYNYHCSICDFTMDIICATMSKQKMDHPSHPHQLQRYFKTMISHCNACDKKHSGIFYQCTTCCFMIHLECALLPTKLLIQQSTNESFTHTHSLTLAYSFPHIERRARFYPVCKVCEYGFSTCNWHYRCDKCRYYTHVDCATSVSEAFMSIFMHPGLGKTSKNFKDDDHLNLIRCPFPNESFNLLKHLFSSKLGELTSKRKIDGEMFSHPHPLILFETLRNGHVSLHDPMKRVELLCDGCVCPITDVPFYKCFQDDCGFVLHEWCTRLPSEIQDHHGHPNHTLVLQPQYGRSFGVFQCNICNLMSNGFTYGCMQCEYHVDINCAFIPDVITHEAHPNHLLQRNEPSPNLINRFCKACQWAMDKLPGFHCLTCDFYLHTKCALLLPGKIRHKYDKHALSLRYYPAENHRSEYFCEICEDEFNPNKSWFYHCSACASSMHTACAPLKLHCEKSVQPDEQPVFRFLNVKFGRSLEITDHLHPLTYEQGLSSDGECDVCNEELEGYVIFKCFQCKLTRHEECWCV